MIPDLGPPCSAIHCATRLQCDLAGYLPEGGGGRDGFAIVFVISDHRKVVSRDESHRPACLRLEGTWTRLKRGSQISAKAELTPCGRRLALHVRYLLGARTQISLIEHIKQATAEWGEPLQYKVSRNDAL